MKATDAAFESILKAIQEERINTKEALMSSQELYALFWFAMRDFVTFVLHSRTSGKNNDGEAQAGNARKIQILEAQGATTKEDIRTDCMIKIIDKLDLVLKKPLEFQKFYCQKICNNIVNDHLRRLPPPNAVVSLQDTIKGNKVSQEDNCAIYEDIIGDNTYNAEELYIQCETISELSRILMNKKTKAHLEKKTAIIREISVLSKQPTEVLVRLGCTWLKIRPRDLTANLINEGCRATYIKVLSVTAKEYDIKNDELSALLADIQIAEGALKVDTKDPNAVAREISRVLYKAKKHLNM